MRAFVADAPGRCRPVAVTRLDALPSRGRRYFAVDQ